jgi:hypothetical protein
LSWRITLPLRREINTFDELLSLNPLSYECTTENTMKYLLPLLCFSLLFSVASAQIPNAGFETWSAGNPTGWFSNNAPGAYTTLTQVGTAHSGSSAVRGDVATIAGSLTMGPILQVGSTGAGFAYTQRPTAFTGYYQFTPASGSTDQFLVSVNLTKGGLPVAVGAVKPAASSSYAMFTAPLTYLSADAPDLCFIQLALAPPSGNPKVGSFFIIDDLAFSFSSTGIEQNLSNMPGAFVLEQNYPNPFNPSTAIRYELSAAGAVKLTVLNTLGQEVETLVNEIQNGGRRTVGWDAVGQPSGIYYYRLQAGASVETKKMILLR